MRAGHPTMRKQKGAVYIASKPLQYMVCEMLAHQKGGVSHLIMVNMFVEARSACERASRLVAWKTCSFAKNRFLSFFRASLLGPSHLYIDGDIGTRLFFYCGLFKLLNPRADIYVYEEGIGTYREDIYESSWTQKIKSFFFKYSGISTYFGGCYFTSGVYVYCPNKYSRVFPEMHGKIRRIDTSLQEYCISEGDNLMSIFGGEKGISVGHGDSCALYLSGWDIDIQALSGFPGWSGQEIRFAKYHPYIRRPPLSACQDVINIPGLIPAELLILELAASYSSVVVFHHGSSASEYITLDNVFFVNIYG